MTHQLKLLRKNYKNVVSVFVALSILMIPDYSQAQAPPPPGPGNHGGNPDGILGVPFDSNMNIIFLVAGIVFAVFVFKKLQKKRLLKA